MTEIQWLRKEINERKDGLVTALTTGGCDGWDGYKYICGQLQGLEFALQALDEIIQRQENHNDE
jgi:hypothetical protein